MPDVAEDFENLVNAGYLVLIIAGIGLVVYIGYEVYEIGSSIGESLESIKASISESICSLSLFADTDFCIGTPIDNTSDQGGAGGDY